MPWVLDDEEQKPKGKWEVIPEDQPVTASGIGKSVAAGIPKGLANIAGTPAALDDLYRKSLGWVADKAGIKADTANLPGPLGMLLGQGATIPPEFIRAQIEKATGPLYEPQNRAEKFADTATQFAVGMGKPSLGGAAMALSGAAGAEGAGAATGDNGIARFLGGLLGGGIPAMANAFKSAPAQAVRQATGPMTEQQIAEALAKQAAAQKAGVPLMGAESMPNSGLQQLAADVNASRAGSPAMRQFIDQRADQVRGAVGGLLGKIGPEMTPEASAGVAQSAATDFLSQLEGARTAAVNPFYQAARKEIIGPAELDAITQKIRAQRPNFIDPAQQAALSSLENPLATRQGIPASVLDTYYQTARKKADLPSIGASSDEKVAAAALRPIVGELKDASASPSIQAGRDLFQQITERTVAPTEAGPVGRIAGVKSGGFDPSATPPVQRIVGELGGQNVRPETIRETYQVLNQQDKSAFPAIARTYLETEFDKATQRIQAGDNRMMGANFSKAVYGTDQQRANFDEMLKGVAQAHGAPADQFVKGAKVLMDTLEATGKVPGVGSPTAGRAELHGQLGKSAINETLGNAPLKPLAAFARWREDALRAGRYEDLARVLTAPDSVEQIVRMAKLKPNGMTAQWYAAQLFGLSRESANGVPQGGE